MKGDANLPNAPFTDFLGNAVTLAVVDWNGAAVSYVHMELCLADSSSSGNVYMWSGSAQTGSWMYVPTYHLPGWDCAATVWPGTYTRN